MTDTVSSLMLVTYKLPLAELNAMALGASPTAIGLPTAFVEPLIGVTVSSPALATYKLPLAELNAMPKGPSPTAIGLPTTVFVLPSMTDTVSSTALVTYKLPLAELNAMALGPSPTAIGLPTTVFVLPSMTDTVSSTALVTYKLPLAELNAMPKGPLPTRTFAITDSAYAFWSVFVSDNIAILDTVTIEARSIADTRIPRALVTSALLLHIMAIVRRYSTIKVWQVECTRT